MIHVYIYIMYILLYIYWITSFRILGYSSKGRNPSASMVLKTCFLLYYKTETYKVPNYLLFYKHDYVGFFYSHISITLYF